MGRPNLNDKIQTLFMRRRGEVRDLGMLMAGVAVAAVLGWCSLVKLRISSEPRGAAAILRRVFHFYDCMASPNYRVTGQLCCSQFGEFPRLVGRYCSNLLPKQARGTPQIDCNRILGIKDGSSHFAKHSSPVGTRA